MANVRFYRQLIERLEGVPGVRSASVARRAPLSLDGGGFSDEIVVEGYTFVGDERPWSYGTTISPGYFRTLGIPITAGRDFTFQDDERGARVVIINELLASRYWRGLEPVGRRLQLDDEWLTIVGIVPTFKSWLLNEGPTPFLFLPVTQFPRTYMTLLVRTENNPAGLAPSVRQIIREIDSGLPLYAVRTLERQVEGASFPQRSAASFLGFFGILAMLLAAVGTYGVMAYNVAQRTREIGLRMALGAERRAILRLIMTHGFALIAAGAGIGLVGAAAMTRVLAPFLVGIGSTDALSFAGAAALLAISTLVACYIPTHRAMRVDPSVALRNE